MTAYQSKYDEWHWLSYFRHAASDPNTDRFELLKQLAGVAVPRPVNWDYAKVRRINPWDIRGLDAPKQCFCCRTASRRLYWHHIIEVQHGGSAAPGNLTALCYRCHRVIHPWLVERSDESERWGSGWTAIGTLDPPSSASEEAS
jgi:hypothetical protein